MSATILRPLIVQRRVALLLIASIILTIEAATKTHSNLEGLAI